jgi:hypothetical protein
MNEKTHNHYYVKGNAVVEAFRASVGHQADAKMAGQ